MADPNDTQDLEDFLEEFMRSNMGRTGQSLPTRPEDVVQPMGGAGAGGTGRQALAEAMVKHPRLADKGQIKDYEGLWEMAPIDWLKQFPGNALRNPIDALKASIETEGVNSPLILNVGKNSRTAVLGEGNHRLAALQSLGYTHAPTRTLVGGGWGADKGYNVDEDLIPQSGEYFSADAPPSRVFRSFPKK